MLRYETIAWMKYIRRHEANVFNALFHDVEAVTEEDVCAIIRNVALFFNMPVPKVNTQCETFAKVMTSEDAEKCELYYNLKMLVDAGVNNKDAFTMALVHEMSHQILFGTIFMLFANEFWVQEFAADLIAGYYAGVNNVATGKFKYAISLQKASLTHPNGKLREEIVDMGRKCSEKEREASGNLVQNALRILPAFVYGHFKALKEDWENVQEDIEHPKPPPPPYERRIEDLPDTNLIKQYVMKHKNQQK